MENDVYRALQRHLDKENSPVGYPETKSGVDLKLLQLLITPEEAEIAANLSNIKLEPAGKIHKRIKKKGIKMPLDELKNLLERMKRKGTILAYSDGFKEAHYKNAGVTAGGIVDFQVNRLTPELIDTFVKYHEEQFANAETTGKIGIPQLRTIPVQKSLPVEKHRVSTYDDVRNLVETAKGPLAVANCACRQTRDVKGDDESCNYSDIRETCLHIGTDHARQYVEMGIGRYITKEEAYEILDRACKAGFILQPENSLKPETICCCCGDCCGLLKFVRKMPRPVDLYASNYFAAVDPEKCTGCETCVKRCQLDARKMENGKGSVDLDRCIGCGNCVVTCESKASSMIQKEKQLVPFKDKETMFMKILEKKVGKFNMLKIRARSLLGLRV